MKTIKWDGRRITKPGIYSGVSLEIYHAHNICAGPSISSSGSRAIYGENASPKRFFSKWQGNPNRIIRPEPRHFIIGRALHHLVLGEPFFAKLFCTEPEEWPDEHGSLRPWNNNRRVCRKWNDAREKEGKSVLRPAEVEAIKQMSISLGNHSIVRNGALNGAIERSLFWQDKETGIWLKSRPDAIPSDSADFTDIKTTRSTEWPALQHTLDQFGYYRQIALLNQACNIVLKMPMESFTLLFVEKTDPWHTRDVRVAADDIRTGEKENRAAINLFAKCLREKRWPGPGDGREGNETLSLSTAARERKERRLEADGEV